MPDSKVFLVIGPTCWAKGKTEREAMRNLQKYWPSFAGKFDRYRVTVYRVDPDTNITSAGDISFPVDHKPELVRQATTPKAWKDLTQGQREEVKAMPCFGKTPQADLERPGMVYYITDEGHVDSVRDPYLLSEFFSIPAVKA